MDKLLWLVLVLGWMLHDSHTWGPLSTNLIDWVRDRIVGETHRVVEVSPSIRQEGSSVRPMTPAG